MDDPAARDAAGDAAHESAAPPQGIDAPSAQSAGESPSTAQRGPSETVDGGGRLPMPSPWAIAVAVLALLAFGVVVGTTVAKGHRKPAVLVADSPSSAPSTAATSPPATSTPQTEGATTGEPASEPEAEAASEPESEAESGSQAEEAPAAREGSHAANELEAEERSASAPASTEEAKAGGPLPPVKHVFLIVLGEQGYDAAYGTSSKAPYLSSTLRKQGELIDNYYAVSGGELANGIALISGQGPTPQTAEGCPTYEALAPGTKGKERQALGSGCVYPAKTLTIANQLEEAGLTWKAYVQGLEGGKAGAAASTSTGARAGAATSASTAASTTPAASARAVASAGAAASCRHPVLGETDGEHAPSASDPYVTWRNPFVYFSSLTEGKSCEENDVALEQLATDLKSSASTPSFSYISPDPCDDGSEQACAPGRPSGLGPMDGFLEEVVPEIERSTAYREGGLIAITFAEASQTGPNADSTGCCLTAEYPNLADQSSSTSTSTSSAGNEAAPSSATSSTTTSSTASPGTATSSTTSSTTTTTSTTAAAGAAPPGGGRVGLLLISQYVKPNSTEVTGQYNHFSLLLSLESLFKLHPKLGYAGAEGLLTFESSVFTAYK